MDSDKTVIVTFKIPQGHAKLLFNKVGDTWQCNLTDEFMDDLVSAVAGDYDHNRVRWVDIPNLGDNDESRF